MTALAAPRLRVLLEQPGREDFLQYDVQTDNRDMTQWDFARARRNYPDPREGPSIWMTFLAWNALRRSAADVPDTFDGFNGRCVQVSVIDQEGNVVTPDSPQEEVDAAIEGAGFPTRPEAVRDFASS